ncbi:hypothetical protein P280DRAFT_519970 [Massarina eburnea CBS 473.64]|uniref:Uncharacterized protein n=1 Tax=Massarina eburnea CBS 473.64 TaxID=1395130 RepID=A0A6A6RU50_9PLEO|nr:hypothetical protein P280DRAFT_519970 [Massarina eburnea CBS 473.64]
MGDGRMRSVPNLGMGRGMAYPGQGMGMGMGKYGPESEGDMNGIGGMGAPGNMPYGMVQPRPQQMMQRPPPQQRQSYPPPGVHEIAGGAYATRAHTAPPPVSRQVNRAQANNAKVGPSGQEWLGGDPFLDACTCTTNCTCRKGQRVLYRAKGHMEGEEDGYEGDGGGGGGGGTGGNGNGGGGRNAWGEIRYVLKEDVGRDCGDHSGCKEKKKKKSKKRSKGRIKDESDSSEEQTKNIRKEVIKELQAQLGDFHREHNGGRMPPQMPFSPGTGLHPNLAVMDPTMQQLQQQQLQHQQLQQQQQQLQQQYLQQTLPPNVGGGGRHNLNSFPPGMYPMNMAGIPGEDYDEGTSVYGYPRDYVDMSQQRERHRPRRNRHAPPPEYMDPRRPPRRGGGGGRRGPPPMGRGMMGGRGRGGRRGPSPFEDDEDEYYPPPPPRGSRSGYGDEEVDEDGDWDDDDGEYLST